MELTMTNGFNEMNEMEMQEIEGGVDWNFVGGTVSTVAGGYIGTKIGAAVGSAAGPVGTVVGGIVGAAAGAIIYSLWD